MEGLEKPEAQFNYNFIIFFSFSETYYLKHLNCYEINRLFNDIK